MQFEINSMSITMSCLILAIDCRNVSVNGMVSGFKNIYVSVYISVSHIFSLKSIQHKLTETQVIKVPHNDLLDACNISPFKKLLFLDLSFNNINEISRNCFASNAILQVLLLNENSISLVELNLFTSLTNLTFINISNNPIGTLPWTFLINSIKVKSLAATNISLGYIHSSVLGDINVCY